jgi:hypothetical protein
MLRHAEVGTGPAEPGYIFIECPESESILHRLRQFSMKASGSQ